MFDLEYVYKDDQESGAWTITCDGQVVAAFRVTSGDNPWRVRQIAEAALIVYENFATD